MGKGAGCEIMMMRGEWEGLELLCMYDFGGRGWGVGRWVGVYDRRRFFRAIFFSLFLQVFLSFVKIQ